MMFNSRGFKEAAGKKGAELEAALLKASENGKWPIVCDTSPCLAQIKAGLSDPALRWARRCWLGAPSQAAKQPGICAEFGDVSPGPTCQIVMGQAVSQQS
jgi:hypothetical protein